MQTLGKLALGILSIEPIAFFVAFIGWVVPSVLVRPRGNEPPLFDQRLQAIIPLAKTSSVVIIVLIIVYAALLARRPDLQIGEKVGVPAVILLSNGIALPFVWWLYIWRRSNLATLSRKSAPPNSP